LKQLAHVRGYVGVEIPIAYSIPVAIRADRGVQIVAVELAVSPIVVGVIIAGIPNPIRVAIVLAGGHRDICTHPVPSR